MLVGDRALIVCVSSDAAVRERLVRQVDLGGVVLLCADLDELRDILFPAPGVPAAALPAGARPAAAPSAAAGDADPFASLVVDPAGHRATWHGRTLPLTRLELRMLGCLATPPGEVWSYQRLFSAVWGGVYLGDSAILHSAMKRLRGRLRTAGTELEVETVRGVGYRLAAT
ncbi:MAG: winged helix-turn-helix transcriptional regulator [Hamadaea sp.]|nr:winged helix-turn-helix transcriptional regulator [Hamadaea sp.]